MGQAESTSLESKRRGKKRLSEEFASVAVAEPAVWTSVEYEHRQKQETASMMNAFARERWERRKAHFECTHSCDGCRKPIDVPVRYHCSECSNYDLCASCFETTEHSHPGFLPGHTFARETLTAGDAHDTLMFDPLIVGNVIKTIQYCFDAFSDRRCFGYRIRDGQPVWVKFRTVKSIVHDAARALHELHRELCRDGGAAMETKIPDVLTASQVVRDMPDFDPVAIIGTNRATWFYADFAACIAGQPTVPFYHTMSAEVTTRVLEETSAWVVFINRSCLSKLVSDIALPRLRLIVLLDVEGDQTLIEAVPGRDNVRVMSWQDFVTFGGACPERTFPERRADDLFTIIYTSGSTGMPKGVMHSHSSWGHSLWKAGSWIMDPLVQLSFAPLAHSSGRRFVWQNVAGGGRTFLVDDEAYLPESSKLDRLIKECQYASPCLISSTPRLWNALYSMYQASLNERLQIMDHATARKLTLKEYEFVLGTRLRQATIGGGASSAEVQKWMFDCFQCIINNGFGTTESGGIASGSPGSVLDFTADCLWKLRSVPELGYDAQGNPPTGELMVKTPTMASGYFKSPDQTRNAFTKDGYFATGDIVQVVNGKCQIIDRAKNFVKLAQGEFVATEHLESVFGGIPSIAQICVHADSLQSFLVAVVVPNYALFRKENPSLADVEIAATCGNFILAEIAKCALSHKLAGYECPRGLLISPLEFTPENSMLTSSLKPNRRAIAEHFKEELTAKYAELSQVQLVDVLRMVLPVGQGEEALSKKTFAELGGDSLRAQKLQAVVASQLGVDVPINMLLGGQMTMEKVAEFIELRRQEKLTGVDQDGEPPCVENIDVAKLVVLPEESYQNAPFSNSPLCYFLTGATGFLGLHILDSLLRLEAVCVECLVRAKSVTHGKQRLQEAAARSGMQLDFDRIVICLGDVAEPRLGLADVDYDRVLKTTYCVVHCAALVNSRLSALQLLPSNALSVRECIALCGQGGKPKRFVYVSTSSVVYPYVARGEVGKEAPLVWDEALLKIAGGYAVTKLIGELFCYEARKRGLNVCIIRPSSISPHPQSGDYNSEDTFCRIVAACLMQHSVPAAACLEAHTINMVPVDWCAGYVAVAASTSEYFPAVSNCVNDKSTSWSTIVQWLSEAEQCKQLEYDEWATQLRSLIESSECIMASAAHSRTHPLQPLLSRFEKRFPYFGDFYTTGRVANDACNKGMQAHAPPLTKESFVRFLALLKHNKPY